MGGEEGGWARDEHDAEQRDERGVLCGSGEGLVQEEVAAVACYGWRQEGDYHCVGNGEVL